MYQRGKISFILILLLSLILAFTACTSEAPENENADSDAPAEEAVVVDYANIDTIAVADAETLEQVGFLLGEFSMSMVKLTITYKSEETVEIPAAYSMVRAEDKAKLSVVGTHSITLYYGKFVIEFTLKLYDVTNDLFEVTFFDWERNRIGDVQYLKAGEIAVVPNLETREGYEFIGWQNMANGNLVTSFTFTESMSLVAAYEPSYYNVNYFYKVGRIIDGKEYVQEYYLDRQEVKRGGSALECAPTIPIVYGYSNGHWEDEDAMKSISEDERNFYAVYDKDYVNATFVYYKFVENEWYYYNVYWNVGEATEGITPPDDVQRTNSEIFLYWYIIHDGIEVKVDFPYVLTSETVFYAKYVPVKEGSDGLSIEYITDDCDLVDQEGFYITGYDGDDRVIAIPNEATVDADRRYVFIRHDTLDGWCSARYQRYLERTQLNATFCDCNAFGVVLKNGGRTVGLANHSSAEVEEETQKDFKDLALAYDTVMAFFYDEILDDALPADSKEWVLTDDQYYDAVNDYNIFYSAAKRMYTGCGVEKIRQTENSSEDNLVIGINRRFMISQTDITWSTYDIFYETIARLFGYNDIEVFSSYVQSTLDSYLEDPIEESDVLKFDGAFYVNGYFVFPFAFDATWGENSSTALSYFFYNTQNGVSSIWLHSALAAYLLTETIRSEYDEESAPALTIYGRCKLFEVEKAEVFEKRYYSDKGSYLVESEDAIAQLGSIYYEKFAVEIAKADGNDRYYLYYPVSVGNGDPVPDDIDYYVENNDAYRVTTDTVFRAGTDYYIKKEMSIWNGSFFIVADLETNTYIDPNKYYTFKDNSYIVFSREGYYKRLQDVFYTKISGLETDGTYFYFKEDRLFEREDEIFFLPQNATKIYGLVGTPFIDNNAERFYVANSNTIFRENNGSLYSADLSILYAFPTAKKTDRFVAEEEKIAIKVVSDYAFYGAKKLETVVLPDSVTKIGAHAFQNCTALTEFAVPSETLSLGDYCFSGDSLIESIVFSPSSRLESIGEFCFSGLYRLDSFILPPGVKSIGKGLFNDCISLASISADGNDSFTVDSAGALYGREGGVSCYYLFFFPSKLKTSSGVVSIDEHARVVCEGAFSYNPIFEIVYEGSGNKITFESGSVVCPTLRSMRFKCAELVMDKDCFRNFIGSEEYFPQEFYFDTQMKSSLEVQLRACFSQEYLRSVEVREYDSGNNNLGVAAYKNFIGGFGYEIIGGEARITAYRGGSVDSGLCEIPEVIDSYTVTTIAKNAFRGNLNVTEVVFPDSVVSIEEYAFYDCGNLTKVTFGPGLKRLGDYAFGECVSLTEVVASDMTNISEYVGYKPFDGSEFAMEEKFAAVGCVLFKYNGYDENVVIPENIYTIAEEAFYGCISMNKITFGEDLQLLRIMPEAFYGCDNVTEVVFPNGLETIESNAFCDCDRLFAVVFHSDVNFADNAFEKTGTAYGLQSCHFFYEDDEPYTYNLSGKEQGSNFYILSAPVIKDVMFEGWFLDQSFNVLAVFPTVLESDTTYYASYKPSRVGTDGLVYQLTDDGYEVTSYTGKLQYVTIPDTYAGKNVVSIGEKAFYGKDVVYISIPSSIKHIGADAFKGTTWLNSITDKNIVLGDFLIQYTGFQTVYSLPSNIKYIADGAFAGNKYIEEVTFGINIYAVPENCFDGCVSLEKVVLGENVKSIGKYAFKDCTALKTFDYSAARYLTASHLAAIHHQAFDGSYWLNYYSDDSVIINDIFYVYLGTDVTLKGSVNTSGTDDSSGKKNDSYHIPNGVTYINPYAFYRNNNIRYVYVPESVAKIGECAFAESRLEKVFYATTFSRLTEIGDRAFYNCKNAVDLNFRDCTELRVIGEEAFAGVKVKKNPDGSEDAELLLNFTIPSKVEQMGESAFENSDIYTLYFLEQSRLVEIPAKAFKNAQKLVSVRFLGSSILSKIDEEAFSGCTELRIFTNDGALIESIGKEAFRNCNKLDVLGIEERILTSIGNDAFAETDFIDSTDTMVFLGSVLMKYNGIQSVVRIPEETTEIANNAFADNDRITSVVFTGSSLKRISANAFGNCLGITTIELPSSVEIIEAGAFAGCENLSRINFSSGELNGYYAESGVLFRYYVEDGVRLAELMTYPNKLGGLSYTIKDITVGGYKYTVTSIADYAFYQCRNLRQVTVARTVKNVGKNAFFGCTGLTEIIMENDSMLETIGENAFAGVNITYIVLSSTLKTIGKGAFDGCSALKTVYYAGAKDESGIAISEEDNDVLFDVETKKHFFYFRQTGFTVATNRTIDCALIYETENFDVEYSVANTSLCTVDRESGEVTGVSQGSTTLVASVTVNDKLSFSVSVTISIR